MKVSFCFVRHGETLFNRKGRIQGVCDSPLSVTGIHQADQAREALREVWFHHVFVSPAERCMDTAEHILAGRDVQPEIIRDLHEVDFGKMEGTRFTSHPDELRSCFDKHDFASVNGESSDHAEARIHSVMKRIVDQCEDGDHVLIVSHGYLELFLMQSVLHMDVEGEQARAEKEGRSVIPNCGILDFTYEDGKWKADHFPVQPEKYQPQPEKKTVHFWYVRHGETLFNLYNRLQGWSDSPLTENGIRQAQKTASVLSDIPFASVYTSRLQRARDTADILVEGRDLQPVALRGLKEVNFGDYEGVVCDSWMEEINRRHEAGDEWSDVGGESASELQHRILHTLDKIRSSARDGDNVLLVSHGSYYMNILRILFGMNRHNVETIRRASGHRPFPNGGIFRFDSVDGNYELVQLMISAEEYQKEKEKKNKK